MKSSNQKKSSNRALQPAGDGRLSTVELRFQSAVLPMFPRKFRQSNSVANRLRDIVWAPNCFSRHGGKGRSLQRRSRLGNTLVESALVLFVFLNILIGVFDFAQMLFVHQFLVERAREATRYGVVNAYDEAGIRNMVLYQQPTQPSGENQPPFGLTPAMVQVSLNNSGTNDATVQVIISDFPVQFFTPLIGKVAKGMVISASLPYETP
jgi:hypothetical protein